MRAGWSCDPNDYTTECQAAIDLQAVAAADAASELGTGWAQTASVRGGGGVGGEGDVGRKASNGSSSHSRSGTKGGSFVACRRRFVSRFSVHSTASGWEGTTGPVGEICRQGKGGGGGDDKNKAFWWMDGTTTVCVCLFVC